MGAMLQVAHHLRAPVAVLTLLACLMGCSSQQAYNSAQAWQRNECRRLPVPEQQRCLASNAMSFEEYQRQAAAASKPQ
jgi:hypothetical protein